MIAMNFPIRMSASCLTVSFFASLGACAVNAYAPEGFGFMSLWLGAVGFFTGIVGAAFFIKFLDNQGR